LKSKRVACCLLALCLILSMAAGCAYNPETVLTVDGTDIKAGVYLYYQLMTVMSDLATASGDDTAQPKNILNDDRDIEGVPAHEWVHNKTLEYCREHVFIEREFKRLGLSFSTVVLSSYQSTIQEQWSSSSDYLLENGVSYDSFEDVMINTNYKRSSVQEALYKYGGEKEIPKEDYDAYFREHYTRYDSLTIPLTEQVGGTALLEEFETQVVEIAQKITDEANVSGLENAYLTYYPEIATIEGDTTEINSESYATTASLDNVINDTATSPHTDLVAKMFEKTEEPDSSWKLFHIAGETLIIYRVTGLTEEDDYKSYETALRNAISEDPFKEYVKNGADALSVSADEKAVKYYSIDKIKFS